MPQNFMENKVVDKKQDIKYNNRLSISYLGIVKKTKEIFMVEWTDPRVLVAIYAAFVATISLSWNIFNAIKKAQKKVKVKYIHHQVFEQDMMHGTFTPAVAVLTIEATNMSESDVYVKKWSLRFNKKINIMKTKTNEISTLDIYGKVKYPYLIKRGEIFKDQCGVKNLCESIKNQLLYKDKVQVIITDTFEKEYKSKKFKYKSLLTQIETEELYNKQHREKYKRNMS
jgi:hypothetical protein